MKMTKALGWTLVVLGVWEGVSPFVLGYGGSAAAAQAVVLGVMWAAFGLWLALTDNGDAVKLLGWLSVLLGVWLVLAPAFLGYTAVGAAFWNDLLVGFLGVVVGMWAAFNAPAGRPAAPKVEHH